jgi:hypothetical protein
VQTVSVPHTPTLAELYRAKVITDADLEAAVSSYLADPKPGLRHIAQGVRLDIAAAVKANEWARIFAHAPGFSIDQRRSAIKTAILLARVSG